MNSIINILIIDLIILNSNNIGKYVNNYERVNIICYIKLCEFVLLGLSKSN